MFQIAMVTRKLKPGKTYEDFRKAWFHTTGFGTSSKFYTVINAFNPREIIVFSITDTDVETFKKQLDIEIKERLANPLDDVIEPEDIDRKFGLLVAEDDFSATGAIDYQPPTVAGQEVDLEKFANDLKTIAEMMQQAIKKRDWLKKEKYNQQPKNNL